MEISMPQVLFFRGSYSVVSLYNGYTIKSKQNQTMQISLLLKLLSLSKTSLFHLERLHSNMSLMLFGRQFMQIIVFV